MMICPEEVGALSIVVEADSDCLKRGAKSWRGAGMVIAICMS